MTWICSVLDWKPWLVYPEHGYARLREIVIVLQITPPELWSMDLSTPCHPTYKDIVMYFDHKFLF